MTYRVTDSRGNQTSKDFVLHVNPKKTTTNNKTQNNTPSNRVNIEDVIANHRKDNTRIGIDVSKWQGEINWEDVKNSGVEFAIIRVRISNRL